MNLFDSIILNMIILTIVYPLSTSSTPCSIFLTLNCSCFQSNIDLNQAQSVTMYSHLYCQGHSLNNETFQLPFGSNFNYQNRFRTVSIEFFLENQVIIQSNQFDILSKLVLLTSTNLKVNFFSLRLKNNVCDFVKTFHSFSFFLASLL